jgi:hypothetical protein
MLVVVAGVARAVEWLVGRAQSLIAKLFHELVRLFRQLTLGPKRILSFSEIL